MQVTIQGTKIDTTLISYNDGLNFGRFSDDTVIIPYEIVLEKGDFIKQLEKRYTIIREEIRQDDIAQNETSEFTNTNYCSLSELLNYNADLQEVFITYLDRILYKEVFSDVHTPRYIINNTISIAISNEIVIIKGFCYEK